MNKFIMEATAALANMQLKDDECTPIWNWRRQYPITPGLAKGIITRADPEVIFFQTQDEAEDAEQMRREIVSMPCYPPDTLKYIATDAGQNCLALYSAFTRMSNEMKNFLSIAREKGRPPFNTLEQKFNLLRGNLPLALIEEEAKASIGFSAVPPPLGSIEDHVDYYLYLLPAFNGAFEIWRKNRVCEECGNIFFYKLERARFCSTQCQMRGAYKKRREK